MKKTKAVITTSANPFHYGHLDLYNKAKNIFGDVLVVVAINSNKSQNKLIIEEHLKCYKDVDFVFVENETVAEYCSRNDIKYIVRGIRNGVDAEYELKLDFVNKEINPEIQTVFIPTTDVYSNISSSTIRELLKYNKYNIVSKYMNTEAMYRYIYSGEYKYVCYFGKSCVGKSNFLKGIHGEKNIIDVDKYFWTTLERTTNKEFCEQIRQESKTFFEKERFDLIKKCAEKLLNKVYWDAFFSGLPPTTYLDWASVGFYYDLIPEKYRAKMIFIELDCSEEKRQERIKLKGFENKIELLDKMYSKPQIVHKVLKVN